MQGKYTLWRDSVEKDLVEVDVQLLAQPTEANFELVISKSQKKKQKNNRSHELPIP